MRPDEFEFLLAGASLIVAFSVLRMLSIWIEKERRLRVLFWLVVLVAAGVLVYGIHPDPQSLRLTDFADSFISIGGWLLPP